MPFTVTELLANIKRRAGVPSANGTFATSDFLAIANEQMLEYVVPLVLKEREDYWTKNDDQALVDGTVQYRIPYRAYMSKLREVSYLDADSNVHNIPRIRINDLADIIFGFWITGDQLNLANDGTLAVTTQYGVTLRQTFTLRPNVMIETSGATTVLTFNATAKTITLTIPPAAYTGNTSWDIIRARTPFDTLAYDAAGTLGGGGVITFSGSLPADLAAGDYVTLTEQSPVPQLPVELHGLLAQKCAVKILEAKRESEALDKAREELTRLEADAKSNLSPRVDGEAVRYFNRGSLYRVRF